MNKYEQFAELLKDPSKNILSDSIEETQANLKANGLDFSIEELEELAAKVEDQENEELNETALDDVAGGVATLGVALIVCTIISVGAGHVKKWLKRR